ncbi:MAG: ABC transporter ATP-binding protein [Pseudomonadales bacterium]|jgi:ATP-binding cassette subfamily B protein|nr:ABC transporter ATP-binding protein [Pseudomonadales bacterium]
MAQFGQYTAPVYRRQRIVRARPSLKHLAHLKRLLPYAFTYRSWIILGITGILASRLCEAQVPMFMRSAIDSLALGDPDILLPVMGILGVVLVRSVISIFSSRLLRRVAIATSYDIRKRYFSHVQTMGSAFFNQFETGDVMARSSGDIAMVRSVVAYGWVQVLTFAFSILVGLCYMLFLSPKLTLLVLIPTPLVAYLGITMSRRLFPLVREQRQAMDDVTSFTSENLNGIRTVQAMAQEKQEIERFEDISTRYASLIYRTAKYRAKMNLVMPFVTISSTLIILGYGGQQVLTGQIGVGTFVAFFAYMHMVTGPIGSLGGWLSSFTSAAAATQRLFEVLDYQPEIQSNPVAHAPTKMIGEIAFKHFTYRYPGAGEDVVSDISLSIAAGEVVAFLGRIGCGKSTVLKSLVRFNDPQPGTLFIDNVDIRGYPLEQLRSQIALIPQDPFLFSLSIRDNLTYDNPERDQPPIDTAAQLAELVEAIEEFPDGMGTIVGERGITLSGGQKQRATLARGLIRDAAVLAMDDCFSSVDTRTEERILRRLKSIRKGRTTLLISHRVSTARHADRIFVMDRGRIVESGNHAELMAHNGYYANLEAVQSNQDQDRKRKAALLRDLDIEVEVVSG